MILFIIINVIVFIFYLLTKSYKKQFVKELNRKEHRLKCLYNLIMYLEDKFFSKLSSGTNGKISNSVKALLIKENIEENIYLLKIKKLSLCFCILMGFLILGLFKSIEEQISTRQSLVSIQKPSYGEGEKNYNLVAIIEGEDESIPIKIKIEEKKYTYEECVKKIEQGYRKLVSKMLGENKTFDDITKPLNLVSSVNDIKVSWSIENTQLIDFNGKIRTDNIEQEGVLTYIYPILSFGEVEKEYEIPMIIKPLEPKPLSIKEKVMESIQENDSDYEKEIILPKEFDQRKITFVRPADSQKGVYIFLGILGAISIYIGLNKELYAKVKKRNAQMQIDYPEIVSKLTLLLEAGLSISGAWSRIIDDYNKGINNNKRYAYEEMCLTNIKIKNGTPEGLAYSEFGKRCNLQSYIRLSNLLEQNLTKGTKGLKRILEQEVNEAFQNRKNTAKIRGEEASTKLLFPMILMLGIVIVIIVVPSFLSMKL